jgi:hypothetical protein
MEPIPLARLSVAGFCWRGTGDHRSLSPGLGETFLSLPSLERPPREHWDLVLIRKAGPGPCRGGLAFSTISFAIAVSGKDLASL